MPIREILIVSANIPKPGAGSPVGWVSFRNQGAHRIASALRIMGRDVEVVDNAQWFSASQASQFIASRVGPGTKMLAFSCAFWFGGKNLAEAWAAEARAINPEIKIAVCGPKASSCAALMSNPDLVVAGYAEACLPDLLGWLDGRDGLKAKRLASGTLAVSCQADYPMPTLPDLTTRLVKEDFVEPSETLFLEASRGCVFRCAFCDFHLIGKRKGDYIRPREAMLEQMEEHGKWGVDSFILCDETANELDSKLEDLGWAAQRLRKKPMLSGFVRADLMASRPAQLDLMAAAGLMRWHVGLETFNPESARAIGKGAMAGRKTAEALDAAKSRFGEQLAIGASIIVGLPHDTERDLIEMSDWLLASGSIGLPTYFRLHFFDRSKDPNGLLVNDGLSLLAGDPARYGYRRYEGEIPSSFDGVIDPMEFPWVSKAGMDILQACRIAQDLEARHVKSSPKWRDVSMWTRAAARGLGAKALEDPMGSINYATMDLLAQRRAGRYVRQKLAFAG